MFFFLYRLFQRDILSSLWTVLPFFQLLAIYNTYNYVEATITSQFYIQLYTVNYKVT